MLRVVCVDQHVEGDEMHPIDWCLRNDVERLLLLEEEALLTKHLQREGDEASATVSEELPDKYKGCNLELLLQECYEQMELKGVAKAEARALAVLKGLGFDEQMARKPTQELSGGWIMRASLAAAIFSAPDLLLLDEVHTHSPLVLLFSWGGVVANESPGYACVGVVGAVVGVRVPRRRHHRLPRQMLSQHHRH